MCSRPNTLFLAAIDFDFDGRVCFRLVGWRRCVTEDGRAFYSNDIEMTTSWDPPININPPTSAVAPAHGSTHRTENGANMKLPYSRRFDILHYM